MPAESTPTVALLTDLWPSASSPQAGTFVRGQVEALSQRFRQVVVVPRLLLPRVHARIWGGAVNGAERGWADPAGGRLVPYPILRVPRVGEAGVRARSARIALAAARERPRLVHAHFLYEVGVAGVRLASALGVPSVVTVHGTDARWLLDGGIQEWQRRSMLAAVRAADRVLVVERGLAERLGAAASLPDERVVVLPMGVDETAFQPRPRSEARRRLGLDQERPLILFVGRGETAKGVDLLDAALSRLDADCVAVGSRGVAERIRWAGVEPPERVALWLAAADVFCLPSRAEGMPVSVMEALACGRPVVASGVGGISEQVDEGVTGLLVPPDDVDALAAALDAALRRDWDEETIRAASRRFWWSILAPRLAAVYEELL